MLLSEQHYDMCDHTYAATNSYEFHLSRTIFKLTFSLLRLYAEVNMYISCFYIDCYSAMAQHFGENGNLAINVTIGRVPYF